MSAQLSWPSSQSATAGDDRAEGDDGQAPVAQLSNLLGDGWRRPSIGLPALGVGAKMRLCDPDAGVDDDGSVGKADHRVEVELGELREIVGEPGEPVEDVGKRGGICRWSTSEAGDEPARLARGDELVRIDIRQRGQPEVRVTDELGEHTPRAEGDERAEDRVLRHAGEELDTDA